MSTPKTHPSSLVRRMEEFFANNPDEELSYDDAKVKFGGKAPALRMAVMKLKAEGKIECFRVIRCKGAAQ